MTMQIDLDKQGDDWTIYIRDFVDGKGTMRLGNQWVYISEGWSIVTVFFVPSKDLDQCEYVTPSDMQLEIILGWVRAFSGVQTYFYSNFLGQRTKQSQRLYQIRRPHIYSPTHGYWLQAQGMSSSSRTSDFNGHV